MLGSDEWVDYSFKKKAEEGISSDELRKSVIETWEAVQVLTKMRLIEEDAPSVVASLQEKGFPVMILTTRGDSVSRATRLQLLSAGIDMTKSPVHKDALFLQHLPDVHFVDGILFANGRNKGACLISFLHQIGYTPKRILFIDDKQASLKSVEEVEKEGITFLGLRYTCADSIVRSFDALLADIELAHLQQSLLSDEQASSLKELYTSGAN